MHWGFPELKLAQKEIKKAQRLHQARLKQIQAEHSARLNNSQPFHRNFTHISKQDKLRTREIAKLNKQLSHKITHISASPATCQHLETSERLHSLNYLNRKSEARHIFQENKRFARRISEISATLSLRKPKNKSSTSPKNLYKHRPKHLIHSFILPDLLKN